MKEYLLRMLWCITTFLIFKVILYIYQLKNKKKRVLLFGLSGNPPTGESGHRGIIQEIEQLNIFNEIWILPVYQHTFNSKKNLLPFETRMELCRLNFQDFKTCKVIPIEKDLFFHHKEITGKEEAIGTINLLKFLKTYNNNIEFTFCLGGDTFNDLLLGKWFDNDEIIKTTNLLVINRKGYEIREDILNNKNSKNIKFLTIPYVDEVSSTKIKDSLDGDHVYAIEKLYSQVYYCIKENNLYKI